MRHPAFSLECGLFNIVPYDKVRSFTTVIIDPRKFSERKILIVFLPINLNMWFGCSKESSH